MNRQHVQTGGSSISILGLLGVVFVALKLMGYIAWSWWWVTAPFWGPWALIVSALIVGGFFVGSFFGIAFLIEWRQNARRRRRLRRKS